jgi:diadenylate cyclase
MESIVESVKLFFETNVVAYFDLLMKYPIKIVALIVDLLLVGWLLSKLIKMVKGTRAMLLIKGIAVLIVATAASDFFSLNILHYILSSISTYGVILVIVIFQPELRKTLEQFGTADITKLFDFDEQEESAIDAVVQAVYKLSETRTGALIVFEREMSLNDIIATGVKLDSAVSKELLENIFVVDTPLHDGAVIIKGGRIAAAATILPLTARDDLDREYGTRHRAALGVSEETDAIVVVVSEETGKVSLVIDGKIIRGLNEEILKNELIRRLERKTQKNLKQILGGTKTIKDIRNIRSIKNIKNNK